jgi:hypothetical protein
MDSNPEIRSTAMPSPSLAIALSITFSGPLFFVFNKGSDTTVDVYAPHCPYHEAGIYYTDGSFSETNLWSCSRTSVSSAVSLHRHYSIHGTGIEAYSKTPVVLHRSYPPPSATVGAAPVILTTKALKNPEPRLHKKLFKLTVPRPEYVYPLYSDLVEVVPDYDPNSAKNHFTHHATGLRFLYRWDAQSKIELKIPNHRVCNITPPVFGGLPTISDVEIRYQGIDLTDQNDQHSDARSCFASLATLAGSICWLNYGDGRSSPTNPSPKPPDVGKTADPCEGVDDPTTSRDVVVHSGGDCHAPVIVDGLDSL